MYFLLVKEKTIHRDLKPKNILLDEKERAFIGDVGTLAKSQGTTLIHKKRELTNVAGSTKWMAPEMLKYYVDEDQKIQS